MADYNLNGVYSIGEIDNIPEGQDPFWQANKLNGYYSLGSSSYDSEYSKQDRADKSVFFSGGGGLVASMAYTAVRMARGGQTARRDKALADARKTAKTSSDRALIAKAEKIITSLSPAAVKKHVATRDVAEKALKAEAIEAGKEWSAEDQANENCLLECFSDPRYSKSVCQGYYAAGHLIGDGGVCKFKKTVGDTAAEGLDLYGKYKYAIWAGGALLSLGVVAFVARPYISILSGVTGRRRRRRRRRRR